MFGEYGSMNKENGKAKCHLCGRWFLNVGLHIARGHKIDCAKYREMFGLSRHYPLCGEEFSSRQRKNHSERLKQYIPLGRAALMAQSKERLKQLCNIPRRKSTCIKNSENSKRLNSAARLQSSAKRLPALLEAKKSPEYRSKLSEARKRWPGNAAHMKMMRDKAVATKKRKKWRGTDED